MKSQITAFVVGAFVGAAACACVSDDDRKKFQKTVLKQIAKLREEHEGTVRDGIDKVMKMVESYTAK